MNSGIFFVGLHGFPAVFPNTIWKENRKCSLPHPPSPHPPTSWSFWIETSPNNLPFQILENQPLKSPWRAANQSSVCQWKDKEKRPHFFLGGCHSVCNDSDCKANSPNSRTHTGGTRRVIMFRCIYRKTLEKELVFPQSWYSSQRIDTRYLLHQDQPHLLNRYMSCLLKWDYGPIWQLRRMAL